MKKSHLLQLTMLFLWACEATPSEEHKETRSALWPDHQNCSMHAHPEFDPATGATSCICEPGWTGDSCETCEGSHCPSLSVRGVVTFGEEKGESRIAHDTALKPDGAAFSTGDVIVTEHTVKVHEVRMGDRALEGSEITVWIRGGEVPVAGQPDKSIMATYFGGGYLVEGEHYEIDLAPLTASDGRQVGYYIPSAHEGLEMLPPPLAQGGSSEEEGQYLNPVETPEICKTLDDFEGFDSF